MLPFARALYDLHLARDSAAEVGQARQGLVEYAVILGCVATVLVVALLYAKGQLAEAFSTVGDSLAGVKAPKVPNCPLASNGINCR